MQKQGPGFCQELGILFSPGTEGLGGASRREQRDLFGIVDFYALGAVGVAEFGVRALGDIGFNLVPRALFVADIFTEAADWQKAAEGFYFDSRTLQIGVELVLFHEVGMPGDGDADGAFQFGSVGGLDKKGAHACSGGASDIVDSVEGRKNHDWGGARLLNLFRGGDPILFGHGEVHDDDKIGRAHV